MEAYVDVIDGRICSDLTCCEKSKEESRSSAFKNLS
mgnify:CR=1 FL=1